MDNETVRSFCLSLPHATEGIQWGNDLLFRVGGKMFAVIALEPSASNRLAFKCTPEKFEELIELDGIIPAPYMARNKWISLQRFDALKGSEIKDLIRNSYEMVFQKLPKKVQEQLKQSV
ncbi:MAG: MmcQ/YjbR family DNA-binding protein [Blastocatellia bacterium]